MTTNAADDWWGLGRADFEALAETYGTPFYLYDADVVAARIDRVRSAFAGLLDVYFAVKANPNLALLRAIKPAADGLDISSDGELEQASRAQYDMRTLSFAGPAKTGRELEGALLRGVGSISVESRRELEALIRLAGALRTRASIVLRVNPLLKVKEYGIKMGGRPVQFGIDEEELDAIAAVVRDNSDTVDYRGVHVYTGSQCFEPQGVAASMLDTLRLARRLESEHGLSPALVNFGGGFGVSHDGRQRELDVEATGALVAPGLRAFRDAGRTPCRLVLELGRFLIADAGIYVTRVVGAKTSRGIQFFVADGGLNHHLSAGGTFGVGLRGNYPLRNLSRPGAPPVKCHVAGPSCNPTDLLGMNVEVPRPEPGDLLGVLSSGCYGYTASPLLFLGRATPAELVRSRGRVELGRRSRTIADFN